MFKWNSSFYNDVWAFTVLCSKKHPIPGLSPGKSHGRRSLVGCSPWGR